MAPTTAAVRLLAGDKEPVRAATTANITLSGLQTIDGVVLVAGDRVLVKDQTDATENGIYTASAGTWYRAPDANSSRLLIAGMKVAVQEGTAHADDIWSITTNKPDIGDDDIEFELSFYTGIIDDINAARDAALTQVQALVEDAEAAAAGVSLPSIVSGNAGRMLVVKTDETGYVLLPPTSVNVLSLLSSAEVTDILAGTNATYSTVNPKIAAAISALNSTRPGSTLDLTPLQGVWPGATAWFNTLHTADITLITGRVELQLSHATSEQFRRPSLMRWIGKGTKITEDGVCSGITSVDTTVGGLVATYNGSSTCTATGTRTLNFASVTGLHVGTRIALAGGVLDGSMTFTLNGGINSSVTSFSTNQSTSGKIAGGTEVYLRIDSETILATSVSGTSFSGLTRGANGSTAASHSNGATVYWKLAQTAKVVSIAGNIVTVDADVTELTSSTPVRWGAYRSSMEGEFDIDGGWQRLIDGVVTADASNDVITFTNADATLSDVGLVVGRALYFTNSGGALPNPLVSGTTYYIQSIVDAPSRKITISATSGGGVLDLTTNGTGTTTAHVDRAYSFVGFAMSVASECHAKGKISIKNNPHGHAFLHGCGDCHLEFDRFETSGHLLTGIGGNLWMFGSNDRCSIKVKYSADSTNAFIVDDKSTAPSQWGLDQKNTYCEVHLGPAVGMASGGGITRSQYCTATIQYLDASTQNVSIDNDEGQSSNPQATDTVGNTIVVYAMSASTPIGGDAVPGDGTNSIVIHRGHFIASTTLGATSIGANTSADVSVTVTGVKAGAVVNVSPPSLPSGLMCGAARATDDHIIFRFANMTGGSLDAAGVYHYEVTNT